MKIVLTVGNALNASKGGFVTGVKLGSLQKITNTKSNEGLTVLAYIILHLEDGDAEKKRVLDVSQPVEVL